MTNSDWQKNKEVNIKFIILGKNIYVCESTNIYVCILHVDLTLSLSLYIS